MTDSKLIAACVELAELRDQLRRLKDADEALAADIIGTLVARGVAFCDFRPGWRASLETPETATVDLDKFAVACRECDVEPDEAAACVKQTVSVPAARKLLADLVPFHTLCTVKRGTPRLRLFMVE